MFSQPELMRLILKKVIEYRGEYIARAPIHDLSGIRPGTSISGLYVREQ